MTFDTVILSGGGAKGIIELGVLQYHYEKKNYIPEVVKVYAGTSIGAVIALLLICGYKPMDLFNYIYELDNLLGVNRNSFHEVFNSMGLMSIQPFVDKVTELVENKLGRVPTLKELKEITGKTLVVTGTNISKMSADYYTPVTKPNLSCVNAIRISCNLPLIFQKLRYNNDYCVDGGFVDNFPIAYVDNGRNKILGVVVSGNNVSIPEDIFLGYIYRLLIIPINTVTHLRCSNLGSNVTLVKISCENIPIFQMSLSKDEKLDMFIRGYNEAKHIDSIELLEVKGWYEELEKYRISLMEGWDIDLKEPLSINKKED